MNSARADLLTYLLLRVHASIICTVLCLFVLFAVLLVKVVIHLG